MTDRLERRVFLDELVVPGIQLSATALVITDPELSYETYEGAFRAAKGLKTATSWWLGDLVNMGERLFGDGDRYLLAAEAAGLDPHTLENYASVCRKVSRSRRREDLGFGHHEVVARLEPLDQTLWLDAAIANGWRREELRQRLRDAGQEPPRQEQPQWSEQDPIEPLSEQQVEEAETHARKTLARPLPAGHPLWETQAKSHAKDVLALAQSAKVSLRDAAAMLVEKAEPNGTGVWVPQEVFEAVAAALREPEE